MADVFDHRGFVLGLGEHELTISGIVQAGYELEHNGYSWFFRHKENGYVIQFPAWVEELIGKCERSAAESVRREVRHALGIPEPKRKAK